MTPTSSVDAFQVSPTLVELTDVVARPVGTDGAAPSGVVTTSDADGADVLSAASRARTV